MTKQIRHQLGKRKGGATVTLDIWHKDFYEFVLSDKTKKVFDAYYFDTDVER